ncbi:MAG: cytochrome c [Ignavibacteriota bacterium]
MRYIFVLIVALLLSSTLNAQEENANIKNQKKELGKTPVPGDNLKNPFTDKINSAHDGKIIFIQNCASCHGSEGIGNGPAGASLIPKPDNLTSDEINKRSDGEIFLNISDGASGVMIPWKFILSENQRWHLVDYIRELSKKSK